MNVREIVEKHLIDNEFDGLFYTMFDCACEVLDLMPCENYVGDCEPGYKKMCVDCNEDQSTCEYCVGFGWCIVKEKRGNNG